MKSSILRVSLAKYLRQIVETGDDVTIEHDSREIAVLSLTPPRVGTPPMYLKISEAQGNWAELLAIVSVRGARYFFKRKNSEGGSAEVYLYRLQGENSRNCFIDSWNKHREAHRLEKEGVPASAAEKISDLTGVLTSGMAQMSDMLVTLKDLAEQTKRYAEDAARNSQEAKAHSFEAKENSLEAKESSDEARQLAHTSVQIQRIQHAQANRPGHILNTPEMGVVPLRTAANTVLSLDEKDDTDD